MTIVSVNRKGDFSKKPTMMEIIKLGNRSENESGLLVVEELSDNWYVVKDLENADAFKVQFPNPVEIDALLSKDEAEKIKDYPKENI